MRKLADLRVAFELGLPARYREIGKNFTRAAAADSPQAGHELLSKVNHEAHKLSGSAGIFGLPEISEAAKKLERACLNILKHREISFTAEAMDEIGAYIKDLIEIDIPAATAFANDIAYDDLTRQSQNAGLNRKTVLLIDDDHDFAASLQAQLTVFGFDLVHREDPEHLAGCLDDADPAVIIMDIAFPDDQDAGVKIIKKLRTQGAISCPVVFLSRRRDIAARLGAFRAGCSDYLVKPFDISELVTALLHNLSSDDIEPYRVLIVDDDPDAGGHYRALLEGAGFEVVAIPDPMTALDIVHDFHPDGILLDVHMPGCSGIELASVLRQDQDLLHVPIIFLTGDSDQVRKLDAVISGGDEFLLKTASPDYVIATIRARTHRARELKRKFDRLGRSENHFRSLAQRVTDAIVSIDEEQRIVQWNRGAAKIFGYREEEILGLPIIRLFPKQTAGENTPPLFDGRHEGAGGDFPPALLESLAVTKNGDEISIEMSVTDWHTDEQWHRSVVIRDITERKQMEHGLQEKITAATKQLNAKSQRLQRALKKEKQVNQMQRQFVAMASHEFRTPLAIIDSTAQRISSILRNADKDGVVSQKISKIRRAVQRLTNQIESTLAAENIDSGKTEFKAQSCNLQELVFKICRRQREIDGHHKIICDIDALPVNITADTGKLDQVFTNLLSNAIKYSPEQTDIEVRGWQQDGQAVVSVSDYGLGIPEAEQSRIFDRFFRASSASGIVGTGIGLYLVKEFVGLHDGFVDVVSKEGEGTTITIRIPTNLQSNFSQEATTI